MNSFALVVPVFDEAERLEQFGTALVQHLDVLPPGSEVIFVDDGSTDATAEMIDDLVAAHPRRAVRLLRRPHLGKGATVAAGLAASDAGYRGFCDLDLSTPLEQFELIRAAAERVSALAIGSRDMPASQLLRAEGPVREWLGRSYNRLLQATVAPGLVDTQCGAKVASGAIWDAILPHCREEGYAWDAEVIAVARALQVEIHEVPVAWCHDERSKVNVGRDGLAMVWAVPRIWRRARIAGRVGSAPDALAETTVPEVFDEENAERLMAADRDHWWFRSKAAFVSTALARTGANANADADAYADGWLVDAGAGSGGVTSLIGWRPHRVAVVEGNQAMVGQARHVHGLAGIRGDVGSLPFADESVSVVCLLDVIEHVERPTAALAEAARVLAPGGRLVVNVPAHEWLWSAADEALGHVRRYDRDLLRRQLADAGVEPELLTHVFSWLVPAVFVARRVRQREEPELGLDASSVVIDRTAMVLTRIERGLVGRINVPFGTSLLAVARKPERPRP